MATFPVDIVVTTPGAQQLNPLNRQLDQTDRAATGAATAARALGAAIAAIGVGSVVTNAISVNRQFNKSISELSAITGATGRDLKFLTDASKEFGATTTLSASQAATAFKLIASAKPDLLESVDALKAVTREAITLAEATGQDLPTAAKAVGSALNQFQLDASKTSEVINILAASAQKGTTGVANITDALRNAGATANVLGVDFAETVAALQAFAKGGLDGAAAGTALNQVMLRLERTGDKALQPSVAGLSGALDELARRNLGNTELMKLFGDEAFKSANIILGQRDALKELNTTIRGTSTAYEQAATNVDNFNGDLLALQSAFEGVQIEAAALADGGLRQVTQALTAGLQGLNENPERIAEALETLGTVATATAAIFAGRLVSSIVAGTREFIANTAATLAAKTQYDSMGLAIQRTTVAANIGTASIGALNRAMTFLGGPVGVVLLAATALTVFNRNTNDAEAAVKALNVELNTLTRNQAVKALRDIGDEVGRLEKEISSRAKTIADLQDSLNQGSAVTGADDDATVRRLEDERAELDKNSQALAVFKSRHQELKDEIDGVNFALDRLNTTTAASTKTTTDGASSVVTLGDAYKQLSTDLNNQINLLGKTGREAAILQAQQKLIADATKNNTTVNQEELKQLGELAAKYFDLNRAQQLRGGTIDEQRQSADAQIKSLSNESAALSILISAQSAALSGNKDALNAAAQAQAVYNATVALGKDLLPEQIAQIQALTAAQVEQQQALALATQVADIGRIGFETPAQQLQREYDEKLLVLQQARERELLTLEEFNRREKNLTDKLAADKLRITQASQSAIRTATAQGLDALAGIIEAAGGKQTKAYRAVYAASRAFALADSIAKIAQAQAQALADPTAVTLPQKIANYAAVATAGASLISSLKPQQFADGGPVSGAGTGRSDSIPAWLSNGEYVMTAQRTAQYRSELDAMRRGTFNSSQGIGGAKVTIINNVSDTTSATVTEGPDGELIATIDRRIADQTPGIVANELADPYSGSTRQLNSDYRLERR